MYVYVICLCISRTCPGNLCGQKRKIARLMISPRGFPQGWPKEGSFVVVQINVHLHRLMWRRAANSLTSSCPCTKNHYWAVFRDDIYWYALILYCASINIQHPVHIMSILALHHHFFWEKNMFLSILIPTRVSPELWPTMAQPKTITSMYFNGRMVEAWDDAGSIP